MSSQSIEDEVFCLRYRFNLLSSLLLEHKTERWVEGCVYPETHWEHVQRYELASKFANEKMVLDLACGVGQGSDMLATIGGAASVMAGDLDAAAIRYARACHGHPNITYQVIDALKFTERESFDLAVCFETIEHVNDPIQLLRNLARSLKPTGQLFLSTPVATSDLDLHPSNPYHIQEWGFFAFQKIVSEIFRIDRIYVQWLPGATRVRTLGRIRNKVRRIFGVAPPPVQVSPETCRTRLEEWDQRDPWPGPFAAHRVTMQVLQCTPLTVVV